MAWRMFEIKSTDGAQYATTTEGDALQTALQWVAQGGSEHVQITYRASAKSEPIVWWDVERDTKVDETDKWFPAIVHRRF